MLLGRELKGRVLGVIGTGWIGNRVAKVSVRGFSIKIIHYGKSRNKRLEKEIRVEFGDVDKLFEEAEIATIHIPLTKETRHLINEDSYTRKHVEGAIVDTEALVKVLKEG